MFIRFFLISTFFFTVACGGLSNKTPKQQLRINLATEPPSLDPRKATDSTSANVLNALFEGLMRIDTDQKPKLALAKSMQVSKDLKTYTFKLREAYWSNGDRVTAEDFLHSWQTLLDPSYPGLFAYKLYVIENAEKIKTGALPLESLGVKALDDETLEIHLKHPTPYFLELLAFPTFFPVNHKIDQAHPDWALDAGPLYVVNGPFRLKTWDHENEIVLQKNPAYWDAKNVKLEAITFSMINDAMTELYMYEMGELDWAGSPLSNLPQESIPSLKQEGHLHTKPISAVYFYKLNTNHFPLNNKNIRKALAYAINRREIVEHITQGEQKPALAFVPPMVGWEASNLIPDGDRKKAQEYFLLGLKELNLKKEDFPSLILSFNTNREHQSIAQAIQQQWNQVLGIPVSLEQADWKVHIANMSKQNYQIGRNGWIGEFQDPVSFLELFAYEDDPRYGGNNETGWSNPEFTAYLKRAENEMDPQKRQALLKKAEALFIDEMPLIPIFYLSQSYLKKPYVQGVFVSSLGFIDYKKAYIEEEPK